MSGPGGNLRERGNVSDNGTPELIFAAARYAESVGVSKINELPGAWVAFVDDNWTIAMNGHRESVAVEPEGCMAVDDLPPFTLAAWWNGWLAGMIDPAGGIIAAHPEGANEERLLAALDNAASAPSPTEGSDR